MIPKYPILGCDFLGVVEQIGKRVITLKNEVKVFGYNDKTFGDHSEYLTIGETDAITMLPNNLNFDVATAITEGSHLRPL